MDRRGSQDLVAGFLEGMTATIDRKVKAKEREAKLRDDLQLYKEKEQEKGRIESKAQVIKHQNALDLQKIKIEGDVMKHKLTSAYDTKLQKDWLSELQGQQQDFTKPTGEIATGQATVDGQQIPYALTQETDTGREPQKELEVDYGALASATQPTMTSGGVKLGKVSTANQRLILLNTLRKIKSVQKLNPVQEFILKGLEKDPLGTGKDKKMTESKQEILDIVRDMKNGGEPLDEIQNYIQAKGYGPEDFAEELEGYSPQVPEEETSMLESIKQFVSGTTTQKISQVIDFIVGKFGKTEDEAIEMIQNIQE